MSGQRATDHDSGAAAAPGSSRRVRMLACLAGVLSLAVCGAVAQASSGSGAGAKDVGGSKAAAAAAPTSTLAGGEATPPDGLGEDPDLDALAQSCFDGDLSACDTLYLRSPVGSDYEAYGDTCGGRQNPGTGSYCSRQAETGTSDLVSTEPVPPEGLGTDPALDALAQSCYAGDMEACDDLYGSAESGSAYRAYGDTCGGRQPENTGRFCTALDDPTPGTGVVPITAPGDSTTLVDETIAVDTVAPSETSESSEPAESSEPTASSEPTEPSLPLDPGSIPPPTMEPTGLGDDPALDALAQSCYDGDLAACDDLYRGADPGTPYRIFGDTCGGRQGEGSGTWCVDAFGPGGTTTTTDIETTLPLVPTTTTTTIAVPLPPVTTAPPPTVTTVTTSVGPTTSLPAGDIPPPTLEPTGLGTDPILDALAQSCYAGDMAACDDLWRDSEPDSSYRNFGDSCAGRQPPNSGTWCVDAFPSAGSTTTSSSLPGTTTPGPTTTTGPAVPGQTGLPSVPDATLEPTGLGQNPIFDLLARSCFDGDMQACDDLFDQAPIGSEYRAYGDTCAGRQEAGTFDYCHVSFPAGARS